MSSAPICQAIFTHLGRTPAKTLGWLVADWWLLVPTELLLVPQAQAKAAKRSATEAAATSAPIQKRRKTTANITSVGLSLSLYTLSHSPLHFLSQSLCRCHSHCHSHSLLMPLSLPLSLSRCLLALPLSLPLVMPLSLHTASVCWFCRLRTGCRPRAILTPTASRG